MLSAIIPPDPAHTPLEPTVTQLPLNRECPEAHAIQLFDDGPLHVEHDGEQAPHCWPALYDPSGHGVPLDVTAGNGLHFVASFSFTEKPFLQAMQFPVPSAHRVHPS
jgi:hypothetical protein